MLTFYFTGPKGEMTESETLVSGMVGKQVRFSFSEEWDGLRKTAVYRAGLVSCTSEDIEETDVIPERVLAKALRRLYVGVYGTDEEGNVVIPTVFVPGPFIHIGASEAPDIDPEDPLWEEFKQALAETVRYAPQSLSPEQQDQARANIGAASETVEKAISLGMVALLEKAVFTEDVSGEILALKAALGIESEPEIPEVPEEPEKVWYTISCNLEHVVTQLLPEQVEQGQSCTVVLTAEDGYVLDTVTVTMGGQDITDSVWINGAVAIPSVTGNVVITAKAVEENPEEEKQTYPVNMSFTNISAGNNQRTVTEGERYVNVLIPYDGCEITVVTVTMGGQDVTASVVNGSNITIPAVTGAVFITAVAQKISNPIQYVAGSIQNNIGVLTYKSQNVASTTRFCCVTKEVTGDVPFVTTGNYGDLYLVPVPETATKVKVTCPGYRIEIKLIVLEEEVYKITFDASWVGDEDVTFSFNQDTYGYIVVNYKKLDNTSFDFNTVDVSSLKLEFE